MRKARGASAPWRWVMVRSAGARGRRRGQCCAASANGKRRRANGRTLPTRLRANGNVPGASVRTGSANERLKRELAPTLFPLAPGCFPLGRSGFPLERASSRLDRGSSPLHGACSRLSGPAWMFAPGFSHPELRESPCGPSGFPWTLGRQAKIHGPQGEIHGAQAAFHGAQARIHGAQGRIHGAQAVLHGAQAKNYGAQVKIHGAQTVFHGPQAVFQLLQVTLAA